MDKRFDYPQVQAAEIIKSESDKWYQFVKSSIKKSRYPKAKEKL